MANTTITTENITSGGKIITIKTTTTILNEITSIVDVSVPPPVAKSFSMPLIPLSDPEIYNHGRGMNDFFGVQKFPVTSWNNYHRFSWAVLNTADGVYNFTPFDSIMDATRAAGKKLHFRIGMVDSSALDQYVTISGLKASYPAFIHTLMMSETIKPWNNGSYWFPNWNSNLMLTAWEKFYKALHDHCVSKGYMNSIFAVDIGPYGDFLGEHHMYGLSQGSCAANDATLIRMVQSNINYWPEKPLIGNIAMLDTRGYSNYAGSYCLKAKNTWGPIGFRSDHLAWFNTTAFDKVMMNRNSDSYFPPVVNILTELTNRWKTSPFHGEPMNDVAGVTPSGGKPYDTLIDEVNYYHLTGFSNCNPPSSATSTQIAQSEVNYRKASKISGFIIALLNGTITGDKITHTWSNTGVAPTYEDWDVWFEIRNPSTGAVLTSVKSSLNLRNLLPGSVTITDTIGLNTGNLYVIVKDRGAFAGPLSLANQGRLGDGAYLVTTLP